MALIDVSAALADSVVTWQDFEWLREAWPGPIVVKGVLTGDDARRADRRRGRRRDCFQSRRPPA